MKIRIICCGASRFHPPRRCSAQVFAAYCAGEADRAIRKEPVHPLRAEGRTIYAAPGQAAQQTAALFYGETETVEEPLLSTVPVAVGGPAERTLPRWLWFLLLWFWRFFGAGKQPAVDQAEQLIQKLEASGEDCILVCQASFARILLDRLRRHGGVITRSGVFCLRPLEQILITRRDMHCGGCQHNCLLSNPGCGVGRDKAARKSG
ncbi:MAG: hypothetical protein IK116_03640 [Firmicutes bacterium]|nr:hypothetical protein [Bacillota bacterium]